MAETREVKIANYSCGVFAPGSGFGPDTDVTINRTVIYDGETMIDLLCSMKSDPPKSPLFLEVIGPTQDPIVAYVGSGLRVISGKVFEDILKDAHVKTVKTDKPIVDGDNFVFPIGDYCAYCKECDGLWKYPTLQRMIKMKFDQ